MADKKEIDATLIDGKIEIKCSVNKKENYALRIPTIGFYASTRMGTLNFSKDGVFAASVGNELDMSYELKSVDTKKVVAQGFVKFEEVEVIAKAEEKAVKKDGGKK